jgi:Tfp pilus assembly protein PilZ
MTNHINTMSIAEVRGRIFELIFKMSESETQALLKELIEKAGHSHEIIEKRKHPRKRTFIQVDCASDRCAFTDFVQNISAGGVYMETPLPFFVGQEISMSFSLTDAEAPVKITGKIVRVDPKGIGIQFNEILESVTC